jgi:hypothetical protein
MLRIVVLGEEIFNDQTQEFEGTVGDSVLDLEHSLVSLSKWESKFQVPFLGPQQKSTAQIYEYIKLMAIDDVPESIFMRLSNSNIEEINEYINSSQTATTFGELPKGGGPREIITSELIYFWMINFNIPFECQTWHLNRLFALIRVCGIKMGKPKKMSKGNIAQKYRDLNAQRRAELGTSG